MSKLASRQHIHYTWSREGIRNYDPDFMAHTCSENLMNNVDYEDIKKVFLANDGDSRLSNPDMAGAWMKPMRRKMNRIRRGLKDKGITPVSLMKYLSAGSYPAETPMIQLTR